MEFFLVPKLPALGCPIGVSNLNKDKAPISDTKLELSYQEKFTIDFVVVELNRLIPVLFK